MRTRRSLIVVALGFVASTAFAQQTPNTPPPEPADLLPAMSRPETVIGVPVAVPLVLKTRLALLPVTVA